MENNQLSCLNPRQETQDFLEVLVGVFILKQHNQLCFEDRLPVKLEPLGKLIGFLELSFSHQVLEAVNGNRLGEGLDKDLQATDSSDIMKKIISGMKVGRFLKAKMLTLPKRAPSSKLPGVPGRAEKKGPINTTFRKKGEEESLPAAQRQRGRSMVRPRGSRGAERREQKTVPLIGPLRLPSLSPMWHLRKNFHQMESSENR